MNYSKSKIIISELCCRLCVGVYPIERVRPQVIYFNLELNYFLEKPHYSDDVSDSLDYDKLVTFILESVKKYPHYHLLEKLAYTVSKNLFDEFPSLSDIVISLNKESFESFLATYQGYFSREKGYDSYDA